MPGKRNVFFMIAFGNKVAVCRHVQDHVDLSTTCTGEYDASNPTVYKAGKQSTAFKASRPKRPGALELRVNPVSQMKVSRLLFT